VRERGRTGAALDAADLVRIEQAFRAGGPRAVPTL
jgi:hypothetical protein